MDVERERERERMTTYAQRVSEGRPMSDAIPQDGHARGTWEASAATPSPALSTMTIPFREAQVLTGLSRNTLYRMLRAQKIPGAQKIGGTWRFHLQTLVDWLACKPIGTPPKSR